MKTKQEIKHATIVQTIFKIKTQTMKSKKRIEKWTLTRKGVLSIRFCWCNEFKNIEQFDVGYSEK